ncbi:MAG: 16S rRNA (guanine(527)-N(7))-methyltransferase RsmG [Roseburia sp.]|nr:16S rRNA (guanine(527)-N(7))-methyltransferase RsmG [Roseburia sp.]
MNTAAENFTGRSLLLEFLKERFSAELIHKFDRLTELYTKFNSVINISAIKNPNDIYIKHYLDSIYPYKYFGGKCVDVGCGGGFPCIPLAIATGLDFIGIDGVGKKLALIKQCRDELGISNIDALHSRSEDLSRKNITFDTVSARAVADTDKVLGFCAPLASENGKIVLYKTQNDVEAKSSVCKKLGVRLVDTVDYTLLGTDIKRRLFIYEKSR